MGDRDQHMGMTWDDLGSFSVIDGKLHWDGREVETVRRIKLDLIPTVGAILTGIGAFLGGLAALISAIGSAL